MKNNFLIIFFLLLAILTIHTHASTEYTEGKHYNVVQNNIIQQEAEILEFFSFYCMHCYKFDFIYNINQKIKKNIPSNIKILQYHVDFLGGNMGKILTKVWAMAMVLGVEETIKPTIFKNIKNNINFYNEKTIKNDFMQISGITSKNYDIVWNSFLVKSLVEKQQKAAKDINLTHVPTLLINSQYVINNTNIMKNNEKNLPKEYMNLITFLLKK